MTLTIISPCDDQKKPDNKIPISAIHNDEKEVHIAPMLDFSKREFRKLFSIMSTRVFLWTDMVVDDTIAFSDKLEDILEMDILPNIQICQIGGDSDLLCGKATRVVERYGYQEINLNIDCPSDRVSRKGEFGAVLMKKADTAHKIIQAMSENAKAIPVSVKCRVGVDDWDDLEFLSSFVERLRPVCRRFILHARKCVLTGLMNARQNRSVPPLNFPRVYELCRMFPDCDFWINGGIRTLKHAKAICQGSNNDTQDDDDHQVPCRLCNAPNGSCTAPSPQAPPNNLRGVMMGRAAIDNPAIFADVDRYFYGIPNPCQNRRQVLLQYCQYLETLYPRRCCDNDERITYKLPVPEVERVSEYCSICKQIYVVAAAEQEEDAELVLENNPDYCCSKPKIASRIVGRALKPIRGMFYGLPKSKIFLQICDRLGQDMRIRNCGPGFLLRNALQVMPDDLLDQEFVQTEECSNNR